MLANSTLSERNTGSRIQLSMYLRCPRVCQLSYSCPSREVWIFYVSCGKPSSLCRCLRHLRTFCVAQDLAWKQLVQPATLYGQLAQPTCAASAKCLWTPVMICIQEAIQLLSHRYPMPSEMLQGITGM